MGEKIVGEATATLTGQTRFVDWLAGMLNGIVESDADSAECDVQAWANGQPVMVTIEIRIKRGQS